MKEHLQKTFVSILISLVLILSLAPPVMAEPALSAARQAETETAITFGFNYLLTQINDDGGVRWSDENSSLAATLRVVQALAAAGYSQEILRSEAGSRPIDYLRANASVWVNQKESDDPRFSVARAGQVLTAYEHRFLRRTSTGTTSPARAWLGTSILAISV